MSSILQYITWTLCGQFGIMTLNASWSSLLSYMIYKSINVVPQTQFTYMI